ncbi:hypothetical protein NLX86_15680 [Streptomyces sp. A3M-1-3]|uniref:hypothetical protein n=1 Tax=Streptomyces sp. A3M-1-3 TaxID=2962044 RepID=UPI0020B6E045|nr:hypothetical protein [Streptomyces sp. A3M-1-3]MCP3819492.1 hypothetical protein [Streptomyces sp. A3M-1-3]
MIDRLDRLARRQLNLATYHQLATAGIPSGTITGRARPGGPWQRLLPRVYLLQTGPPTRHQRALSAVLYAAAPSTDPLAGTTAALTGGAALTLLGVRGASATPVDVLVNAPRTVTNKGYVRTLSTRRWPPTITVSGIPSTRPIRAAADFAARTDDADTLRSVLASVVQSGWCHPVDLHQELRSARALANPAVRDAASELLAGVRSIAEGQARDALSSAAIPDPLWNPRLFTVEGEFLATPDGYWPEAGVVLEIDSAEYHYSREGWQATLRRRLRLESHGLLVVSATPAMVRDTPGQVIAAIRAMLNLGQARREPLRLVVRAQSQGRLW